MNLIRLIGLVAANNLRGLVDWSREELTHTLRLLVAAVILPAALLVLGLVLDVKLVVIIAGLLSAFLLFVFWCRATVLTHLVVLATKGGHLVWEKVPLVDREAAERLIRWMRGAAVSISLIWLLAMILPVRQNVGAFLIAVTCILLLTGIGQARNWSGRPFWAGYALLAVAVAGMSALSIVSPATVERLEGAVSFQLDRLRSLNERTEALTAVEKKADESVKIDGSLLEAKVKRRDALKRKGVAECGGYVCVDDLGEYMKLVEEIERLKGGTYWSLPATGRNSNLPPPPSVDKDDASDADAPPPPAAPKADGGSVAPNTTGTGEASPEEEVYSELGKYGL